jgi:hypothetical protein
MKKRAAHKEGLPEPSHPFARWGAGVAIALWAMGVQDLAGPWNKVGAILTPGVGYVIGLMLEVVVYKVSETNQKRMRRHDLSENKKRIDDLYRERQYAIQFGADPEIVASIDSTIVRFQKTRIALIATTSGNEK